MTCFRTRTFTQSVSQVFDAAVAATGDLRLGISHTDRAGGHLWFDKPRVFGRYPRRFDLAITDSGLGATRVFVSWEPVKTPWPFRSEGRTATRMCRRVQYHLNTEPPPPA